MNTNESLNPIFNIEYLKYFIKPNIILELTDQDKNVIQIEVDENEKIIFNNKKFENYSQFINEIPEAFKINNFQIGVDSSIAEKNRSEKLEEYYSNLLNNFYPSLKKLIKKTEETKQGKLEKPNTNISKLKELKLLQQIDGSSNTFVDRKQALREYKDFNKEKIKELDNKISTLRQRYNTYYNSEIDLLEMEKLNREKDIRAESFTSKVIREKMHLIEKKVKTNQNSKHTVDDKIAEAQQDIKEIHKKSAQTFDKEYYKIPNATYSPAETFTNDQFDLEFAAYMAAKSASGNNVANNENTKSDIKTELEAHLLKEKLNEIKQGLSEHMGDKYPIGESSKKHDIEKVKKVSKKNEVSGIKF